MADQELDPQAIIDQSFGQSSGASPSAPKASTGAPTAAPIAPVVTPQAAPQPGSPQPQGSLLGKAWDYVKKTWTGDVGQNWDTLKRDFVASTGLSPEARDAFQKGDFWDQMKAEYHSTVAAGKLPLDAFNTAISPLTGAGDAATGVLSKAAFKVLPEVPGYGQEDFHQALNTASQLFMKAPEAAAQAGSTLAATTQTVSQRASATGATTEEGEAASATGAKANPNLVTLRAKPSGTSSDAWRNITTMDKGELQRLIDQAQSYAGKSPEELNVTEANAPELYHGIGQVNVSHLQAPGDAPLFVRAVLDNIPAQMRPMSDAELNDQVTAAITQLGADRDTFTNFINNTARDASRLPQAVGVVRASMASIGQALDRIAESGLQDFQEGDLETARGHFGQPGTANEPLSPEEGRGRLLASHLETVQTAMNWASGLSDIGTGLGRGLRAMQVPAVDMDATLQALHNLHDPSIPEVAGTNTKPPQNLADLDQFLRLWSAAKGDPTSQMNLLRGRNAIPQPGWYLRNSFANFYTGSLLAGKAIVKGYMMPAFMGALQTVERTSGAGLAMLNPMLSAEDRATFGSIAKSSAQSYFQTMGDMASAFRYSIDATKNGGRSIIRGGGVTKLDDAGRMGPITDEMIHAAKGQTNDWRYNLGNAINVWPRAVFSLVGGHDELTNRLAYLGRVRMTARVAAARAGVTDPADLTSYINNALASAFDAEGKAASNPDILNEAARASFMNSPSTGPMGKVIQSVNSARNAWPELRYILPVLNVPASGLGEAIRRIPGLSYAFQETRSELSGELGDIRQAEAYGRWITGASLLGTAYGLGRSGILTGAGPNRPQDKVAWENNGYQPYSFKTPSGAWVTYKDWEPVGTILGMMANMTDHTVHYAEDDQTHNKFLATIAGLAEYAKDKAAMQSVSNLLSFGDQSTSPDKFAQRFAGSIASGFEPAFIKYIRNSMDMDLRSKDSWLDYLKDGLPGASQELPPVRNTFGEPVHTPSDASNLYGLMPWTITAANANHKDPESEELDRVYQLTGYAGGMTHPQELSKGSFDPQAVKLENGQTMFDRFAQMRMDPNEDGDTVRSLLKDLFASDDYKDAAYGSATRTMDPNTGEDSKLAMIHKVFQQSDKDNKQRLANESAIAKRYLAVSQAKSDSPDILRTHTADELAGNPPLLKSLGIDIHQYEDKVSGQ